MKAKQWVSTLVPLVRDIDSPGTLDTYLAQVEALHQQCQAMVDARLAKLPAAKPTSDFPGWGQAARAAGNDERRLAAYREGLVKWDAVVHGVTQALGEERPPFPLFRGGLLLRDIGRLHDKLSAKTIQKAQADAEARVLFGLVRTLGYQDEPAFASMKTLIDGALVNLTMQAIDRTVDEFIELQNLILEGKQSSARAMELHSKLFHARGSLLGHIQSLPVHKQLEAYLLIGRKAG